MSQNRIFKIIFVVIVLVAIFWGSETVENSFHGLASYAEAYFDGEGHGSIIIFVVMAILSIMLVSFSSIWLVPFAIRSWGNPFTLVLLLVGWLLGSILSYLVGKYAGYPLVKKIISEKKIEKYHNLLTGAEESFGLIVLSRFVLPSEIPGYLLGIIKYPFIKYMIATLVGELPYAFVMVYFIDAVLDKNIYAFLIWGAIWAGLALLMVKMYGKIIKIK